MNGIFAAAVFVMSISVLTVGCSPARAAFYFEGVGPYRKAPNCVDPYALTCGRYGHVPHDPDAELPAQPFVEHLPEMRQGMKPEMMPGIIYSPQPGGMKTGPRLRTREGLDK